MEKETDKEIIKNSQNNESNKKDNISEDDFWNDKIELNINFDQYNNINNNSNISTPKNHDEKTIQKDTITKEPNNSVIMKRIQKLKMGLSNYNNIASKSSKWHKTKLHKSASVSNMKSNNIKLKRFNKLYEEGLISMKKRMEQSMEAKIKKENEYKQYSYSPIFCKRVPKFKNNDKQKNEKQTMETNKKEQKSDRTIYNDIYERNKLWKKTIEEKNTQRILEKKKTETKIKFKPSINDCIMKTDEDFINKNSIEYQAFIDKINVKKNKENIYNAYSNSQRNSYNIYSNNNINNNNNNKIKYTLGMTDKRIVKNNKNKSSKMIKNNKIREMNKKKSFNNRNVFNINNCRKIYGLCDFFNSNDYETIINKDKDRENMNNINGLLSCKKAQDVNQLYFGQDIYNRQLESKKGVKQTYFTFNDALMKK